MPETPMDRGRFSLFPFADILNEYAGWRELSPGLAARTLALTAAYFEGSMTPASILNRETGVSHRCSTRIVGVHVHRFPAEANPGTASDMYDVGVFGEKKGASRPTTTEVFSQ